MSDEALAEAARILQGGRVVAFTGAGISAESGIPTFRDPGGLWDRFDPAEFGTWEGVADLAMSRPDELAEFLLEVRRTFAAAKPTAAHAALVRLERAGLLDGVITQNVDGLHLEAGSRIVVEVHGSFSRTVCLACGSRDRIGRAAFLEALDRAIVGLRAAFIPSLASLLPRCPGCGGPARPDFVAFEEPVHDFEEAERLASGCAAMLVVGTSGEAYPAAGLPGVARRSGGTVIEVVTGPTFVDADLRLEGEAGAVVPGLVDLAVA